MTTRFRYRDMEERLLFNSVLDPVTGCWDWLGAVNAAGYPRINVRINGKHMRLLAHRVSLETFTGLRLRIDMVVDHRCRNVICINPMHLRQCKQTTNRKCAVYGDETRPMPQEPAYA